MNRRALLKGLLGAVSANTLGAPSAWATPEDKLAVIVSAQSPLRALTRFQLKQVFLGATILNPAGESIIPFNHAPNSADRVAFDQTVLGMTPDEVVRYWIERRIRGERGAPRTAPSIDLLQRVIEKLPDSVGYVRVSQLRPGLRVLAVDGRLPSDAAYDIAISSLQLAMEGG